MNLIKSIAALGQSCRFTAIILFIVFSIGSCKNGRSGNHQHEKADSLPSARADLSVRGNFQEETPILFDSLLVHVFFKNFPALRNVREPLMSFYRNRHFSFAWYDAKGLIEPAENLFNRVMNAALEGLPDRFHYRDTFEIMMEESRLSPRRDIQLELMLTAQYFSYASIAWQGLSPADPEKLDWLIPRRKLALSPLLDSILTQKNPFDKPPVYRQYGLLQQWLLRYRLIEKQGGWPKIPLGKRNLRPGDTSVIIPFIRKRLQLSGDLPTVSASALFDDSLAAAIRIYQVRNGLPARNEISNTLIRSLNVPVTDRIRQILVNMERCRWIPSDPKGEYLVVNIPDYKLHLLRDDSLQWSMNVVVGKAQHKTAIFSGSIQYVVFSPYWNIPASIARNEVLPALRRNRNYLQQHDMEWHDGHLRQRPGPNNSLGLVKFLFPNSHHIYLHDTPAKSLFNETSRAFSHGCIRLQDARKLAIYLLRNEKGWNEQMIDSAMHAGTEKTVTLPAPVPVFITYFTAWVSRDGRLQFRNDIYKRDERLISFMELP